MRFWFLVRFLVVLVTLHLSLYGCGGGDGGGPEGVSEAKQGAPVANAGPDQNVTTGSVVTLNGSASNDADGDLLTYAWSFVSKPAGSNATLTNVASSAPTFTADVDGDYVIRLVVNDGTLDSGPDTVSVIAATANSAPVANAGPDQNVTTGSVVTLNGSASNDADGDLLTYAWSFVSKPAGSNATLTNVASSAPTFTADVDGDYVIRLVVNDGTLDSGPDTVSVIAATANSAPVANAGPDQNVTTGSVVTLNGSASNDADGDLLTYAWSFVSKPAGSNATLTNVASSAPTFTADVDGNYVIRLVVNDDKVNSVASTVTVTASAANAAPVANAGTAQNVVTGALVTLDGSASSDANGDLLTYSWAFTSKPAGSSAALSNATAVKPTFTADVAGVYVFNLVVNDGRVNSTTSTVTVVVGTEVNGIIATNTTWTEGDYVLDGLVQIPSGITLTISPGATIYSKTSASGFLVAGDLIATGTAANPIILTANPGLDPSQRKWNGVRFVNSSGSRLEWVTINEAQTAITLDGVSPVEVTNSSFTNNNTVVSDSYGYQYMDFQNSRFISNEAVFSGIRTSGGIFASNYFENNPKIFEYGYYFGSVTISNNAFIGALLVIKAPESGFGYGTVSIQGNWWGTTDLDTIENLIQDQMDIVTLQRLVYSPMLDSSPLVGTE